ncbi:MAG: hypothetical protein ACKV2T_32150 [Kofleriaceae bacterium]
MTRWLVLVASCATTTAVAQPVTRLGDLPCRVTIPARGGGLLVALPLGKPLAIVAGPIVSATRRDSHASEQRDVDVDGDRCREKPDVDARFMAGVRLGF